VVEWRRTRHARPELAYQEQETAALVAHHAAAAAVRARCDVRVTPLLPHVVNDPALTERFVAAAGAALGRNRVLRLAVPRLAGSPSSPTASGCPASSPSWAPGTRPGRDRPGPPTTRASTSTRTPWRRAC